MKQFITKKWQYALPFLALPLQAQNEKPNIILINIDDLGWADLSGNGSPYYETPNIDRLKSQGIWFQQAYAGAANSAPSRACMLTGMNTPRHGIFTVGTSARGKNTQRKFIPAKNQSVLKPGIQILPQVLRNAGYQTASIGKWHVTENPSENGVDYNIAGCHAGNPGTYYAPYAPKIKHLSQGQKGEHLNYRLGDEAVKYLKNVDKSKPFFLYYATYAVHTPLQPPKDLVPKYEQKQGTAAHSNAKYAALIESMDYTVGQVLQAVKDLGIEENTLIAFTTDNGGVYDISRQWPLRAGKGAFYEGGIRIPMVIYQKGKYENKCIDNVAVSQMDLFPTFLEAAHIKSDGLVLDGRSLLPTINGNTRDLAQRPLFWNFPGYLEGGNQETHDRTFRSTPQAVIRKGDWKLIKFYEDNQVELYNIHDDISEKKNLADTHPQMVKELQDELEIWQKETNAPVVKELNPDYTGTTGIQKARKGKKNVNIKRKRG